MYDQKIIDEVLKITAKSDLAKFEFAEDEFGPAFELYKIGFYACLNSRKLKEVTAIEFVRFRENHQTYAGIPLVNYPMSKQFELYLFEKEKAEASQKLNETK